MKQPVTAASTITILMNQFCSSALTFFSSRSVRPAVPGARECVSRRLLLGGESERLKIQCRVMQNTLEQLVWFALCVVPLATYLAPAQAHLVPITCIFFALARIVYWWGYLRRGTLGRAPGVQLTFSLNILLLVLTLVLFGKHLVS